MSQAQPWHEGQMREAQEPARGSGKTDCCGSHRERCLFGRQHTWSRPWFENGRVQRLATTYHCHACGGVCTAEEGDCHHCGGPITGAPVTQPDDLYRRLWCSSRCQDAAREEERQRAQLREHRERAAYLATRLNFREFPVNTHRTGPSHVCDEPVQPHRDVVAWSLEGQGSDTYPDVDLHPLCLEEVKQAREAAPDPSAKAEPARAGTRRQP